MMIGTDHSAQPLSRADRCLLLAISAMPPVLHLLTLLQPGYSYFIDEFYYLACASRPALGYVDHPPLAPLLLAATRPLLGDSLLAIRLLPFLSAGATVWITGLIARRLGAGRAGMALAAAAMGTSPLLLGITGFFSMNAFEILLWALIVLLVMRVVQDGEGRFWLAVGVLAGLSFENKHTAAVYLVALAIGMIATGARRALSDRRVWIGVVLALLITLPNVWWQFANGFPSLEFYRNAHLLKNVPSPPLRSLGLLALTMNPLTLPLWIAGLVFLFRPGKDNRVRYLGLACLLLLAVHVASQTSRPDRVMGVFPILLAAGGVAVERTLSRGWMRSALTAVTAAGGLALSPLAIPLLSPEATAAYTAALEFRYQAERGKSSPIPQLLADRTGWESFVGDVTRVYRSLPDADQKRALLYAPSYGQAGVLELWGPERGLPRVIGSQNSYWHWSAGRTNTDVLIAVDADPDRLRTLFREVWQAGRVDCDYCMSWRNRIPIYVARGSIAPVESVWALAKHYE